METGGSQDGGQEGSQMPTEEKPQGLTEEKPQEPTEEKLQTPTKDKPQENQGTSGNELQQKKTSTFVTRVLKSVVRSSIQDQDQSPLTPPLIEHKCPCEQCRNALCECCMKGDKSSDASETDPTWAKRIRKNVAIKLPPIYSDSDLDKQNEEETLRSTDSWTTDLKENRAQSKPRSKPRSKSKSSSSSWFRNVTVCALVAGIAFAAIVVINRSKTR